MRVQFELEWQILSKERSSEAETDADPVGTLLLCRDEDNSEANDNRDESESDTESSDSLVTALSSTYSAWKSAPYPHCIYQL